jgi:hypothetical protein
MMQRLSTWLIVAVAGTALLVGCGSSSSDSTLSTKTTTAPAANAPATTTTSTAPASTGSSSTSTSTPAPTSPAGGSTGTASAPKAVNGQQAVTACKHAVQEETSIPASDRSKLEGICEKAGSGSKTDLQQVAHEECVAIVSVTPLPAGVPKQRALAICKTP